jgi:predicted transcriptional regulator
MIASELLSEHLDCLRLTDTVEAAIDFMESQGVCELPIVDKKRLYNYARITSLHMLQDKQQLLLEVIPQNQFSPSVKIDQHIYEIVPILASNELSVVAVIDHDDQFLGVVDQKRLNKQITESLTYRGLGAVLVLKVSDRDFAPSVFARWIEENGAKIIGMMVHTTTEGELMVNLKINTTIVKNIVATFQRQNFRVEQVYLSEDFNQDNDRAIDLALKFFDF